MSKIYKYVIDEKTSSVCVDDEIQKYLEKNFEITGETPSEFISFYANAYREVGVIDAIKMGVEDDCAFLKTYEKYGDFRINTNYEEVNQHLNKLSNNLEEDKNLVDKITMEVVSKWI